MNEPCLLCDFLDCLGVPYTDGYTRRRFATMTFQSLFGLSKLLEEYGIDSQAFAVADKDNALNNVDTPFLAHMTEGDFVIVEDVSPHVINLNTRKGRRKLSRNEFTDLWDGTLFSAFPHCDACEPSYRRHRFIEKAAKVKAVILPTAVLFVAACAFVANGLYQSVSLILLTLIYGSGLYVTWQLLLKSLGIHSSHGDKICSLIDANGCHEVLKTEGATFFGLFSWSEVGVAYFSVTLAALLMFPQSWSALAVINVCCCPFSLWSIWYQKYRAKAWCTLCLITQACLWLGFACWLGGRWLAWPLPWYHMIVLGACYLAALLAVNSISPLLNRNEKQED